MKKIIGIDPGLTGAIAFYDGNELMVWDMPTFNLTKNGKKTVRRKTDIFGVSKILEDLKHDGGVDHVYMEHVWAQPGNGAASAFAYGHGVGTLEAVIQLNYIPWTPVLPQTWKKEMGLNSDKDQSRRIASSLLPAFSSNWQLKKDHNRAEAALIALYGWNKC